MYRYEEQLKIELARAIEQAMNRVDDYFMQSEQDAVFPWVGEDVYRIMATAAVAVVKGIEDAQRFLEDEGMLDVK